MHRLLLLAVMALLTPMLATAQNISVTVNGNQVNSGGWISSDAIDTVNGRLYADLQIFTDELTSVPITIGNKGNGDIYIADQYIPGMTMKTYTAEITDGKSDVITISYSPSNTMYPDSHINIAIGESFNFDMTFSYTPKTVMIDAMEFHTSPAYKDGCVLAKYYGDSEEVIVPDKVVIENNEYLVREIGLSSFYQKHNLKKVVLPYNILKIGYAAFFDCKKLEYINLPEGLLEIGESAFDSCESLPAPSFPSSIKKIGDFAYINGFYNIEKITIPGNLTYLGNGNFRDSWSFSSLVFEDGEEELFLGEDSFGYNPHYSYLYLGRNFTGTGLSQNNNVNSLHIGTPVKNIDWFEPSQQHNLKQIVSDSMTPPAIGRFTQEQYDNVHVFVPAAAKDAYENDQNWAFFNHISGLEKPADEYEISIIPTDATINVGEELDLQCTINPPTDVYVNWKSSNNEVLSVYDMGKLHARGVKAGEADVTVTLLLNGKTATCHVTVVQPATDIRINKSNLDLKKGESARILANISPVDVSDATVTWTSSNPEIATVAEDGTVTAVRGGNCEITATTHNGLTATCQVKVTVMPEAIVLDKPESSMLVGESLVLTATLLPDDVTETELVWTSSDTAIATIEGGEVKGIAPGSAVITATTVNNLSASCTVTVMPILAESITVTPETLELLKGTTSQLNAEVLPVNVTDPSVVWSSGDESVATVTEDGTVTAVGKGECTITATTSNGLTSGCKVTVKVLPESVMLDQSEAEVVIGETINLTATLSPDDVTETELVWTSSDPAIATIEDGEVKGMSLGTAVITATTVTNISASCSVTVLPILVETVTVIPDAIEAVEGTSVQLKAVVLPENASDKTISWNSSNVSVATVDETGLVNILTPGNAVITATANDEGKAVGECQVTGLSTVEWLRTDDNLWDLYAPTGLLLKSAIRVNDLNDIAPGIYILRSGSRNIKIRL